jgi:hypothetical protein
VTFVGIPAVAALVVIAGALEPAAAGPALVDVTAPSGIDFVHSNGAAGEKQYGEVMGSGAALLDADGDGRLDVYLVTSVGANRLYRNLGGLRFEDVTERAGVGNEGYGMGAVATDVNGDGHTDLFVTNLGANVYYRNRGDGRFRDLSTKSGLDDARWGTGAAFLDADGDGRLDLYLVNYVQVASPDTNVCRAADGTRLYCPPRAYPREGDALLRQLPDGAFEDVTEASGLGGVLGRGLGVIVTDHDRDGLPDLYVANDLDPNFLFRNLGDGTFEEVGLYSGSSHSEDGVEESGMGLAVDDFDRDGWPDLFVSNYVDETNTLYRNEGDGFFLDESAGSGLGPSSLRWVGWGTGFLDFDLDGWPDLLVVNGHTESDAELVDPTTSWKQRDFLYRNRGDGTFEDVTATAAPALMQPRSGRGAAFGDLDDDGDVDVILVNQNDPALLLENRTNPDPSRWIGLEPRGKAPNREAIGARVDVHLGDVHRMGEVRAGGSYLSGNDRRLLFALPDGELPDSVVVRWPSGTRRTILGLTAGKYHPLHEEDGS